MPTDKDTSDRLARLEKRYDLLDERIDERSKNFGLAFDDMDERFILCSRIMDDLITLYQKGPRRP